MSAFQVEIIFQRNFRIEIRGHEVDQFCCWWMTCSFFGRFEVAHFVFQFEVHSKLFLFVVRKLAVATFEEFFGANRLFDIWRPHHFALKLVLGIIRLVRGRSSLVVGRF